jgi:hypothetical protein
MVARSRIEEVELALRRVVDERLNGESAQVPPHVAQKVRGRIDAASRKQPAVAQRDTAGLSVQLQ